jgi:hypothetical protein
MKSSNLFWGFFFITFGSLYLVAKYSDFYIDWYAIWELWPLLIILAGISIIIKGKIFKPVISVLIGVLLAFLAFGFLNDVFDIFEDNNWHRSHWRDYSENNYRMEYNPNIEHVNLSIKAGAGKFNIEQSTEALIKGYSKGNIGDYNFDKKVEDSIAWVSLSMEDVNVDIFGGNYKNQFQLNLNENPSYSFDLEIGAAKSYFNFIPFKVETLILETGATETKIKLGNKIDKTFVDVKMGAASLMIYIPKTSGCKITGDMVLMSKELRDFIKLESDDFITDNYENSAEKIIMNIQGGVSAFEVIRY